MKSRLFLESNVVFDSRYGVVPDNIDSGQSVRCFYCLYRTSNLKSETSFEVAGALGLTREQYLDGTDLSFKPNCERRKCLIDNKVLRNF